MATSFRKEDDYTLLVFSESRGGGTISRYFNFAAQQVTTLYERKEQLTDRQSSTYGASGSVATTAAVALASEMTVQKFSELDSLAEVRLMREALIGLKGNPPELDDVQDKKAIAAPKLAATTP